MEIEMNANEIINYVLEQSIHNINSLSQILAIPKRRLLHCELMTNKDLKTLLKFKRILKK